MGNHSIGRTFVAAVEIAAERRREGETALEILDDAAERTEIRGADAEFDDAPYEEGLFRQLLIEAFAPDYTADDDEYGDVFFDTVYEPFSQRYGLC